MKLSEEMRGCLFDMADSELYWPGWNGRYIQTFKALEQRGLVEQAEDTRLRRGWRITHAGLEAIGLRELAENH